MKKSLQLALRILCALSLVIYSHVAYAQAQLDKYTVLAPLPGTTSCGQEGGTNCTTDFQTYLPGLFNLSIGIAAVLAFVMITFGGVTYMVSDSLSGKEDGKKFVNDALAGLVLVIGAWVILNTINPKILQFNLNIPKPNLTYATSTVVAGQAMTPDQKAADKAVRDRLTDPSVGININHGPCSAGETHGCTNLNELPDAAVNGLISLKKSCNCDVTVSGGTEGGHKTHGAGAAIVDLQPSSTLNGFLGATAPVGNPHPTQITKNGATYTYENTGDNGIASAPHWHVTFN
jgi:hypothetical protein